MPAAHLSIDTPARTRITRADVPASLLRERGVTVRFHPSGELALVHVRGDRKRNGRLVLELGERGHFTLLSHAGGHGIFVDERYRDGAAHTTLCTPWYDGVESSERVGWRAWVLGALESLASIA